MKRILMIAYDFPPMNTSGSARPQYFAKHLSEFGYWPVVLTREGVGEKPQDLDSMSILDNCCDIVRVQPWDHDNWDNWIMKWFGWLNFISVLFRRNKNWITDLLGWRIGLYFREYVHWVIPGVISGLKAARDNNVKIIWATGPRWGSLRIGYWVSRISRKPLIVDIRDPWTYGVLWESEKKIACRREVKWEKKILNYANRVIYTSPITADTIKKSYAPLSGKIHTITNGFSGVEVSPIRNASEDKCLFVYLGKLDKNFRNPEVLFKALSLLKETSSISSKILVQLYSNSEWVIEQIEKYDLSSMIEFRGFVSQSDSLRLMKGADFLLLMQTIRGEGSDVISGKVYEYLATGVPILGIVPKNGGDAWLLDMTSNDYVSFEITPELLATKIAKCVELWEKGEQQEIDKAQFERFSRKNLTAELASIFNDMVVRP